MGSTVPAKSQPLHNFSSLSCLKWNSHPRHQRRSSSPHQSSPLHDSSQQQSPLSHLLPAQRGDSTTEPLPLTSPPRQSQIRGGYCDGLVSSPPASYSPLLLAHSKDEAAQSPIRGGVAFDSVSSLRNKTSLIEYKRQSRNSVSQNEKNIVSPPNRSVTPEKLEKQGKGPVSGNQEGKKERRSSKILIKLPPKKKKDSGEIEVGEEQKIDNCEIQENSKRNAALDDEEQVPKTWNFRPRKQTKQLLEYNGRVFKNCGSELQQRGVYSTQVNPDANMPEAEKKEKGKKKRGFTIALSKEEIEADIIALIGSNPPRRPKKRSRAVQKQLDVLFPKVLALI